MRRYPAAMSHPHPELTAPGPLTDGGVRVIPLGGLGEVGRNMAVIEHRGKLLIIDCGVLFPEENHPGVDLILPDFGPIEDRLDDIGQAIGDVAEVAREDRDRVAVSMHLDPGAVELPLEDRLTLQRSEPGRHRLGRLGQHRFERPADFDPRAAFPDDPKMIGADANVPDARVRIDEPRASAAARDLGEDRVVRRDEDGAIEVMVPCANGPAFRSWLLGYLEHAEVLEPPSVRSDVIAFLEEALA